MIKHNSQAVEKPRLSDLPADGVSQAELRRRIVYEQTRKVSLSPDFLQKQRIINSLTDKAVINAYRLLRTQVMQQMRQKDYKILGITSPAPQEGKTLTAINLAIAMAMDLNYTALLVDADLRRPSVHSFLGIEPEYGLSDYLESGVPVADILINPEIERLVILPGSRPLTNSSEFLASFTMVRLVRELKARYQSRITLFDLPPVLESDDLVAFLPCVDAVLLVIEDNSTRTDELTRTMELLGETKLLGTVLNKSSETKARF